MADYTTHALAWERDPVITPGAHGRADVASGRMSKWAKYNDPQRLIWVTDGDGVLRGFTRNQIAVYQAAKELSGTNVRVTMRALSASLNVSPSTVWRAMVRLTAYGLLAYQSNRGRNGGTVFLTGSLLFGTEWLRDAAKAKVRAWWQASEERISRLRRNVASMFPDRERELYPVTDTVYVVGRNKYEDWTPESIQEALGER